MDWESNVAGVLGVRSSREVETGAKFQFLIAAEHVTRRHMAFDPSTGDGIDPAARVDARAGRVYRVQYRFLPQGRRSTTSLWIEDHGRWWPSSDGQPVCARGVIRVINERYQEPLDLEEISRQACLSRYHFLRRFRDATTRFEDPQ